MAKNKPNSEFDDVAKNLIERYEKEKSQLEKTLEDKNLPEENRKQLEERLAEVIEHLKFLNSRN